MEEANQFIVTFLADYNDPGTQHAYRTCSSCADSLNVKPRLLTPNGHAPNGVPTFVEPSDPNRWKSK